MASGAWEDWGFRAGFESELFDIVRVNEISEGADCAAHLLEYDSVHGKWDADISATDSSILVNGHSVAFSRYNSPADPGWEMADCEIVIEASGKFRDPAELEHYFASGVKKVVVAAPVKKGGVLNIVMGCNDHLYDPAAHHIVTAASCTTNCIAPPIKVIHENLGITRGTITTIHDVTNTQVIVDAPHKDKRRARSALNSLIPTSTGSATAITYIYPDLKGKLDGLAVRVPLLNASLTDCVFQVERPTSVSEVNQLLEEASRTSLLGILGFEEKPLVSADFTNDVRSGIIDGPSTMVIDGTMVKLLVWYDNEVGYANRLIELVEKVANTMPR